MPQPVDRRRFLWQPAKKWKLYCVAYSHHDLGFGGLSASPAGRPYVHAKHHSPRFSSAAIRIPGTTTASSASLSKPASRSPVSSAANLPRWPRNWAAACAKGASSSGALHNTANTEQLGARTAGPDVLISRIATPATCSVHRRARTAPDRRRHRPDLAAGDVLCRGGRFPTSSTARTCAARCFGPAADEPAFLLAGGHRPAAACSSGRPFYGGYAGGQSGRPEHNSRFGRSSTNWGTKWPYDALFLQEGTDFQLVTMETASRIHAWKRTLVLSAPDLRNDGHVLRRHRQAGRGPEQIKSFAGDGQQPVGGPGCQ